MIEAGKTVELINRAIRMEGTRSQELARKLRDKGQFSNEAAVGELYAQMLQDGGDVAERAESENGQQRNNWDRFEAMEVRSGSGTVDPLQNEKQYGVEYANPVVNINYINSEGYKNKFTVLTDNTHVNNSIYAVVEEILRHRNGTEYEDMVLVNAVDGSVVAKTTEGRYKGAIVYTDEFRNSLAKCKKSAVPIIGIHNHPQGTPPSPDDFRKAFENGYTFGVVVGHNRQVYKYETPIEAITREMAVAMDRELGVFLSGGIDVDRAFGLVYNEKELKYTILEKGDNDD